MVYNDIKHVLPFFELEGVFHDAEELLSGNVNSTYKLEYKKDDWTFYYTLQNINKYVFQRPNDVMQNIDRVTTHLRQTYEKNGINPTRRVLSIVKTKDGALIHKDREGNYWRAYSFISGATSYDTPQKSAHIYETGKAFGEFQRLLSDFPADCLIDTMPNFHNSTRRFYAFVASVAADRAGRVHKVEREIENVFEHRRLLNTIVNMLDSGEIPYRVTHNDTKTNNVLIDDLTDEALCVIDLDTVLPGSALYDFGDGVRFCASTAAEDEIDTDKIALDMTKFTQFTNGFLSQTNGFLTKSELVNLPLGVLVITSELAMRFLTDYIDGDMYFKVRSPEHNLIRARAQMKLLSDMERRRGDMQKIVDALI